MGQRKPKKPTSSKEEDVLNKLQDDLNKSFGDSSVMRLSEGALSKIDHWVTSRSIVVDSVLRAGRPDGSSLVPFGRQMEISGPEDCLDGETFIQYETRRPDGPRINHKGGTLEKLYRRFHGMALPGKGGALLKGPREFFAPSMNDEGRIFQNRIVDVVDAGLKDLYEVVTVSGATLLATAEHKFFVGTGYRPLSDLDDGSVVFLHNCTPYRKDLDQLSGSSVERPQVYVKEHPIAGVKIIANKYRYHRLARSRAMIEASMNDLSFEEYIGRLNDGCLEGLLFLRSDQHVHHQDENYLNDDLDNLVVLDRPEHTRQHAIENHNNLRFTVVQDVVESIRSVGQRQAFDLKMDGPYNNYVANGLVVHNSGKTTLCAQIAAETQAQGGLVLVTDTEEKIAEDYWRALGVDTSKILYIRANDLEAVFNKQYMAMQIARNAVSDRKVLLIWDSLGGTAGAEMIDPDSEESPMEQAQKFGMRQAKVISDGMSLVNTIVSKTRVCYLFTNHEYQKIGVVYGNKRETRGGGKPKYFATVRLQLTPVGRIKEKDDFSAHEREIGKQIRVKALKNHMGGMLLERDAIIVTGRGFVDSYTVFEMAKRLQLITGKGWSTWKTPTGEEVKFQGWRGFEERAVPHAEYGDLCAKVREVL